MEVWGKRRHVCNTRRSFRKIPLQAGGTAAAEIIIKHGFIAHLLLKTPDMGEVSVLSTAEQSRQVRKSSNACLLLGSTHRKQALLGKDHIGQHIVRAGRAADKADGGIRIIPSKLSLPK